MTKTLAVKEILCFDGSRMRNMQPSAWFTFDISGLPSKLITTNGYIIGNIIVSAVNMPKIILKETVYYNYDNSKYTIKEVSIVGTLSGDLLTVNLDGIKNECVRILGITNITKTASPAVKIKYLEEIK